MADASCRKEGVLQFALPRECLVDPLGCEPTFYQADSFDVGVTSADAVGAATSGAFGSSTTNVTPGKGPVITAVAGAGVANSADVQALNGILNDLASARSYLGTTRDNVEYTNFNVRRSENDFARLGSPLSQAQRDSVDRDVSTVGNQLDFIMWGARNSLKDTETGNMRAGSSNDGAYGDLKSAQHKLTDLMLRMAANPSAYVDVLPILDRARGFLTGSVNGAGQLNQILSDCNQAFLECDQELMLADQYVNNIRSDRVGRDVSGAAGSLRTSVERVGGTLAAAEGRVVTALDQVDNVEADTSNAEELLRGARDFLAQAQPSR